MRSISVFCLVCSLFFSCVSVLATPLTSTILERREEEFSNDFPDFPEALDDTPIEKSLVEPTDPKELAEPKKHEKSEEPKKIEKIEKLEKSEKIEKSAHKDESLRGMRCGAALYTQGNLIDAAAQACKLMKEKKKTWGFIKYPLSYQPNLEEIAGQLSSSEDEKPQGPYYLYPILQGGKVTIFSFGFYRSNRSTQNYYKQGMSGSWCCNEVKYQNKMSG